MLLGVCIPKDISQQKIPLENSWKIENNLFCNVPMFVSNIDIAIPYCNLWLWRFLIERLEQTCQTNSSCWTFTSKLLLCCCCSNRDAFRQTWPFFLYFFTVLECSSFLQQSWCQIICVPCTHVSSHWRWNGWSHLTSSETHSIKTRSKTGLFWRNAEHGARGTS